MMGRQEADQRLFFYDFCLDDHVPSDHVLRRIELFLDFNEIRNRLKPHYSVIGRPSIDPELMIRMLIVGYCFGIPSERRLCQEVHLNLAYRWFCRLGLEDRVPDHSTFSLNRHGRFRDGDTFRVVFESVLRRCMAAGLESARERKTVEMLFAHLKRHLGFERLRLRGLSGARDEFLLAATVQNLKRLAKLAAIPPPMPQMA